MINNDLFGKGLPSYEIDAIRKFYDLRAQLSKAERKEVDFPEEFHSRAIESRLFGFWLVIGGFLQDRPFYFWGGLLLAIYEIGNSLFYLFGLVMKMLK
jgi:hypothetical protein